MSTKEQAAKDAAIARANLNTWGAVIALLESGLLSGTSDDYYKATQQVIKIAKGQMKAELKRYEAALARVRKASRSS